MPNIETRSGTASASGNVAEGYAAVFGQKEKIGSYFVESIAPGAFKEKNWFRRDVLGLWNHNYDLVIGRVSAGTLKLEERPRGLWFRAELDERSSAGMTAIAALDRGEVFGCSFGFVVLGESWYDDEEGLPERVIEDVSLIEISLCPLPAYEGTSVSLVRSSSQDKTSNAARRIRQRAEAAMRLRGIL